MTDDVAFLISEKYTEDEFGVLQPSPITNRQLVYVRVSSVSGSEWFDGGRNGLNPELRFEMFAPDYHGEELIEFHGRQYSIYRTYRGSVDTIELYVQRKKGAEKNEPDD